MIFCIHDTILNILDVLAKSLPTILAILHFPADYSGKVTKYADLPATHNFVPIAIQWIAVATGDPMETEHVHVHLFQRLSICTQRHNAIAFRGTFMHNSEDENHLPQ